MNLKALHGFVDSFWCRGKRQLGNSPFIFMWILLFCFTFRLPPSFGVWCVFFAIFLALVLLWFRFFSHTFIRKACQSVLRGKILGLPKRNIPQEGKDKRKQRNEVIDIAWLLVCHQWLLWIFRLLSWKVPPSTYLTRSALLHAERHLYELLGIH